MIPEQSSREALLCLALPRVGRLPATNLRGGTVSNAAPDAPVSRRRRTAFIVITSLLGLGIGFGVFAFPTLFLAWFGIPEERQIHQVHDLGYAAQTGVLFAIPLLIQAFNPERKPAVMLVAGASGLAFVLGYGLGGAWFFIPVTILLVGLLWWLHPARDHVRLTGPVDPIMLALVVIAAVPLAIYAFDQAAIQRACIEGDLHCEEFHYAGMAAVSFAIPLAGMVASFSTRGWRIAAWLTGAAAAVFGLSAVLFPDHTSSVGPTWGSAAIAGGVVFLVVAELRARRSATPSPA